MAVSYSVSTTANLRVGRNSAADPYAERMVRAFLKFDVSGGGYALDDIQSVILRLQCSSKVGSGEVHVQLQTGSASHNWGSTLQANQADFESTHEYNEEDHEITGTGTYDFTIDKAHLNLSGMTYFRLKDLHEGDIDQNYVEFYSQNNATPSNRPKLIINTGTVYEHSVTMGVALGNPGRKVSLSRAFSHGVALGGESYWRISRTFSYGVKVGYSHVRSIGKLSTAGVALSYTRLRRITKVSLLDVRLGASRRISLARSFIYGVKLSYVPRVSKAYFATSTVVVKLGHSIRRSISRTFSYGLSLGFSTKKKRWLGVDDPVDPGLEKEVDPPTVDPTEKTQGSAPTDEKDIPI